jgi:hypothetical protein
MSFVPAGFEDSDEDEFDFGDGVYDNSTTSSRQPLPQPIQPTVGRGRGALRQTGQPTRSRGGFGVPPASTGRQQTRLFTSYICLSKVVILHRDS